MRQFTLKNTWLNEGAKIKSLPMCEYVATVSDIETEMNALRNSVVLTDCSYMRKCAFDEIDGADLLDEKLAANVLKLRYGKAIDTFLADDNGDIVATTTLVNINDKILLFAESINDDVLEKITEQAESLDATHSLLSIDGPDAWKVAKKIFGADIFNIGFMTAEKYDFEGCDAIVMRTGKTGEFGYQILVENSVAKPLFVQLKDAVIEQGGMLAGIDTLLAARMKGNFFNIFVEGANVKNAIELGLQWQIDFAKDSFCGSEAIFNARNNQQKKLIAITCKKNANVGNSIFNGNEKVGEVVAVDASDTSFALALIDVNVAYVGQSFSDNPNGSDVFETTSRPAIIAQSLSRGF